MTVNFRIIGRRVNELRTQNHMSQANLAEQVDMSVTYISNIETARKQASLKSLVLIADALGVTVDSLLSGNQTNDLSEYKMELTQLLEGCSSYEKRVVYEIAMTVKSSLIKNRGLLSK